MRNDYNITYVKGGEEVKTTMRFEGCDWYDADITASDTARETAIAFGCESYSVYSVQANKYIADFALKV